MIDLVIMPRDFDQEKGWIVSDENNEENGGRFGKFKDSTRRVKLKAQEAAQKAAEQAARAGETVSEAATTAAEMKDRAAESFNDTVENILEALNRAGTSVSESGKDAGAALSEEAQLALDIIRARFPNQAEGLDDQIAIVSLMPAQAHRQLVFAYAMFASKWIPIFGAHFVVGKLIRRLSKYADEHKGDQPKKQRGVAISTYRWAQEYKAAKVVWEKQKGTQEKDGGGHQL